MGSFDDGVMWVSEGCVVSVFVEAVREALVEGFPGCEVVSATTGSVCGSFSKAESGDGPTVFAVDGVMVVEVRGCDVQVVRRGAFDGSDDLIFVAVDVLWTGSLVEPGSFESMISVVGDLLEGG